MIHADSWEAILVFYALLKLIDIGVSWIADTIQKWAGVKSTTMTFPIPKEGENIIVGITSEKMLNRTVSEEKK